jgi:hypothetical protein
MATHPRKHTMINLTAITGIMPMSARVPSAAPQVGPLFPGQPCRIRLSPFVA